MRPALYRLILLLLFYSFGRAAFGQHFYVQKYTVNDGLSDSYVLTVYQDSEGFLWVGTLNGLSRYDGKTFINYGYGDGLPNLRVDKIYEDRNKRIWVGTRGGIAGIRGGKCIVYPTSDKLPLSFIFNIQEYGNKGVWAMTDKGVYRFEQDKWVKIALYPGMDNQSCRSIVETRGGMLINYGDRIAFRSNDGRYSLAWPVQNSKEYYNTLRVFNNQIYLNMFNRALHLGNADSSSVFGNLFRDKPINGFYCDSKNRFWIATESDGILVTAPGDARKVTDTLPVTYNLVSCTYEDREGNMWIACIDGLMKLSEVNYTGQNAAMNPLLSDVRNIIKTKDNHIIACSADGLLEYRQGAFGRMALHSSLPIAGFSTADIVDDWCTDAGNRVWLMTRFRDLYLLDHYTIKDISGLAHKPAKDIYWQIAFNPRNNKLWLCSDSLLYGDERGFTAFRSANTGQYIVRPRSVHYFANGYLMVHTSGNRFFLLDPAGRTSDISDRIRIEGVTEALSIYEESPARFWIAYSGGLAYFRWNEQQLPVMELKLTSREGLPNDAVHGITMDAFHRLWALTNAGLVVIEPGLSTGQRPVVHRLSEETGIYSNQWTLSRILTDDTGAIWVSLQNSVYRFDPAQVQFDNTPPAVAIEDMQLNLQPTQWGAWADSLYGYRQLPRQVRLPYYLNNLSLSFRAPCFRGASGIEYSYQLEGVDSGWSAATRNNSISFVKLPAGNYRFRVRARKSNTGWGQPAAFVFTIRSPYWEQWWFRGCILALATALLAFGFRGRIRQVRRKAQVKEQLRELELKALRAQMNPHFIYNALNSIQALVFDHQPEKASQYISKFGRLLRQVLDHSEQQVIPLKEELEALELYIQLEQLRLHADLHYTILPDPAINTEEEWVPPLVLQPFAENALWHGLSRKKGEKKLDITVTATDEWLIIKVADNGIGRRQAAGHKHPRPQNRSKGLDITGRRLQEYNRARETVFIEITDLYDTHQQPCGTSVLLRIRRHKEQEALAQQTHPLNK